MKSLNHKAPKGTKDHDELSATLSLRAPVCRQAGWWFKKIKPMKIDKTQIQKHKVTQNIK